MVCEVLSHIGFRAERSFFASTSPTLFFCFQYLLFSVRLYTSESSSQIHLMVSLPAAEISANSINSLAKDQQNLVLIHFSLIIFCYFLTFHPLSSFHQVMDPSTHLLTQLSAIPPSICAAPVGHYPATRFFALTTEATMVAKVLLSCISDSDWKD